MPYVYSRPYVYSFGQIFQVLHLFTPLILLQTQEYIDITISHPLFLFRPKTDTQIKINVTFWPMENFFFKIVELKFDVLESDEVTELLR